MEHGSKTEGNEEDDRDEDQREAFAQGEEDDHEGGVQGIVRGDQDRHGEENRDPVGKGQEDDRQAHAEEVAGSPARLAGPSAPQHVLRSTTTRKAGRVLNTGR